MPGVSTGRRVTEADPFGETSVRHLPGVSASAFAALAAIPRVLRQPDFNTKLRRHGQRDAAECGEIRLSRTTRRGVLSSWHFLGGRDGRLRERDRGKLCARHRGTGGGE